MLFPPEWESVKLYVCKDKAKSPYSVPAGEERAGGVGRCPGLSCRQLAGTGAARRMERARPGSMEGMLGTIFEPVRVPSSTEGC